MFDITGPKVFVPALVFALLTPGLFISFPPGRSLLVQAGFHAIIFSILNFIIIKYVTKVTVTKADFIMPMILFVLLTPHLLFSIPHGDGIAPIAVHATLFAIMFAAIRGIFPEYY
jgi:hypothetical protein